MEEIEITVINWDKYQTKSDRLRHPHWFRMNRDSGLSSGLTGLSATGCWVWVQILSECCRKNSKTILVNTSHLARVSNANKKDVAEAIEILIKNKTLSVDCTVDRQFTQHTEQDNTIQNNKPICVELARAAPSSPPEETFLSKLSLKSKTKLLGLYPAEYIEREVTKMELWLDANKNKTPKSKPGWARFILGWLERGWEIHRKSIPSNKPNDAASDFLKSPPGGVDVF